MTRVVITGGGTGGHVFPMVAVSEQLLLCGVASSELRFVGSRRGQERTLLAGRAIPLTLLPGRGVRRSWSLRALMDNVAALVGLLCALVAAIYLMLRWRPRAVVSLGGYAALASDVAAVLTRRPLVLVELDAVPSAAHRVVRRFARRLCTAFPVTDPRAVTTGVPIRSSIESIDRSAARVQRLEEPTSTTPRWTVVVMTGSLGARSVNVVVPELASRWRHRSDLHLVHVTGVRDHELVLESWHPRDDDQINYEIVAFADMAPLWSIADVAVCRAGATTVAELTHLGIASVLVPLPGAPSDHQSRNARVVEHAGGAVVVRDGDLDVETLERTLGELLDDPTRLVAMGRAAGTLRQANAAAAIARVVMEVAS